MIPFMFIVLSGTSLTLLNTDKLTDLIMAFRRVCHMWLGESSWARISRMEIIGFEDWMLEWENEGGIKMTSSGSGRRLLTETEWKRRSLFRGKGSIESRTQVCEESLLKPRCECFAGAVGLKLRSRYELKYECGSWTIVMNRND